MHGAGGSAGILDRRDVDADGGTDRTAVSTDLIFDHGVSTRLQ